MSNKLSSKKPTEKEVDTVEVLRTDLFKCKQLHSESSLSKSLIQRHCGFVSNHTSSTQHKYIWCHSAVSKTKSDRNQLEYSDPFLMHSMNGRQFVNRSLPCNILKDLYYHFKQDPKFCAGTQNNHCWNLTKVSHNILKEEFVCSDKSETEDLKVQSLSEKFPNDACDMDDMISISDCVYNQKGQLVRMFICFDTEHSDTSSVVSSSDSDCNNWDSDCDDFIVFEDSCEDENQHCSRFDFMCETCEFHRENYTKLAILTPDVYCEVKKMETFDYRLDSLVQEFLQPNLHYSCDDFILNVTSCKEEEECKDSEDFISAKTTDKSGSKQKKKKKVQFLPDHQLAVVHPMVVWNFAYRKARKGTWEADALDRLRFQKRVKELDEILSPVLLAKMEKFS